MWKKTSLVLLLVGLLGWQAHAAKIFDLPPLPPASEFGNLLIDRTSEANGQKPVGFYHWTHRMKYSCRVCHYELDMAMETNATGITEEANRRGEYCGACHDGEIAFGHTEENCGKCHSGDIEGPKDRFKKLKKLPKAPYGNKIDWVEARNKGMISPVLSILDPHYRPMPFVDSLELEAAWTLIPPAHFRHGEHLKWLDCANCHPDIFKIKKKATQHFLMKHILEGKFCGACHLKVAFPLNNCKRCHPDMRD